jgi:invasion protein IalB
MKDIVYIVGIVFCAALSFTVGKMEGTTAGLTAAAIIAPTPEANLEKQCVAWFFNADLKAAKKHMCGGKK